MRYAAFARLTDPARPNAELWRIGLGLVVVAAVSFGLGRAIFAFLHLLVTEKAWLDLVADLETGSGAAAALVLLGLTGAMGVGAYVAAEIAHRRRGLTLFGPPGLALVQFLKVARALLILHAALLLLPPWTLAEGLEPGLPVGRWLLLLPLTLLMLLIQTGSEELMFRGYLQTQLAARFKHPAVWLLVPSVLFGAVHYVPALYGDNAVYVALWAALFGLAAADLTARAGTLGPAIAFHFLNNFAAVALISMQGELSGLALWRLPFGPGDETSVAAALPLDLASLGLGWLAARVAIRA